MWSRLTNFLITAVLISVTASWKLAGKDVTGLTGQSAKLTCKIEEAKNSTDDPIYLWKDGNEILFFEKRDVQADKDRMSVSFNRKEISLVVRDVQLADEKTYSCGLNGIKPPVYAQVSLTVNQNPQEFYVTDLAVSPVDGQEETVARCFVKGSKPAPKMWFSDENGFKVDLAEALDTTTHDNGLVDAVLTLKTVFTKDNHNMRYKCNVLQADGNEVVNETKPIDVKFATTAYLAYSQEGQLKLVEENQFFEETCMVDGNPYPKVQWSFIPDNNTDYTLAEDQYLPNNFVTSADGRTLVANRVSVTSSDSTNNGTFVCTASNTIGGAATSSFRLGVYAAPATTVPTTQALSEPTTQQKASTAAVEPQMAGSSGLVVGIIIAVTAIVIIIAAILITRYFMAHKGTYHTREMKNRAADEEIAGDDDPMVDVDDDEMEPNKRTEYFM